MTENVFLNIKNKPKTITAEIEVPEGGAHGTIIAQGGPFGGWSLYVLNGVPAYDGGGLGNGGLGALYVDGAKLGEGRIERARRHQPSAISHRPSAISHQPSGLRDIKPMTE